MLQIATHTTHKGQNIECVVETAGVSFVVSMKGRWNEVVAGMPIHIAEIIAVVIIIVYISTISSTVIKRTPADAQEI